LLDWPAEPEDKYPSQLVLGHAINENAAFLPTSRLEQKPAPTLGLINPVFDQTRSSQISRVIAERMNGPQNVDKPLFILVKFAEHILRSNEVSVIVGQPLGSADLADRANGGPANLANPFGYVVRHCEDLIGMIIEEQMVIPKVRPGHMPMKVLGLQVNHKHICEKGIKCPRDVLY
jgi:hypothetical protein